MLVALRTWTARHWLIAALGAVATGLVVALPTAVIPNPVFGRAVEVTWWSYPVVLLTGILGGLLLASYLRDPGQQPGASESDDRPRGRASRLGTAGAFVAFFAVGCPVCNKLVLLALGTTGAITWFAPVQPLLAVASIVLMAIAVRLRLRSQVACPVG